MAPRAITSAFRNAPPPFLTPFASLPLPRAAASRFSRVPALRSTSSSSLPRKTPGSSGILSSSSSQRPLTPFPFSIRLFSSSARRSYGFGNQPYKRFGDPRRQPPLWRLLENARPIHFVIIGLGISGLYFYNTEVVEMTGRRRFNVFSPEFELKMGRESYEEVLSSYRGGILPDNHPTTAMVKRVLDRLIPVAPVKGATWEVHVIKDDGMMNAFVLPGGKVFVFTGILPLCGNEDGLAAVLGHEIAHVVAHHPAENISNRLLGYGAIFAVAMMLGISENIPSMMMNLMFNLPNSRTQEAEADAIGLILMSKACFDPEAAVNLWSRMQRLEKDAPPQFLSTHPASHNRMEANRGDLAKAQAIYDDSGCHSVGSHMPGFLQTYGYLGR